MKQEVGYLIVPNLETQRYWAYGEGYYGNQLCGVLCPLLFQIKILQASL